MTKPSLRDMRSDGLSGLADPAVGGDRLMLMADIIGLLIKPQAGYFSAFDQLIF